MNLLYKILAGILICCLCYLIGNWIPLSYLHLDIEIVPIKSHEYINIIISLISAIVTFIAVLIALFKDDLRKLWNYSKLEVQFADDNKVSEKLEMDETETTSETGSRHYKAEKYESKVIVENIGNKTAKNCETYLEKLLFENEEFSSPQNLTVTSSSLSWESEIEKRILIPPKGKKSIILIELFEPKKQSLPDGKEKTSLPELHIGGVISSKEYKKGKWTAHFVIHSDDSEPKSFILELNWNGKWEQRFSEIQKCLQIKII